MTQNPVRRLNSAQKKNTDITTSSLLGRKFNSSAWRADILINWHGDRNLIQHTHTFPHMAVTELNQY